MILAILLAAGLAWWLHKEGVLLPNLRRLGVTAGAAIIAIRLLETGQPLAAITVGGGGVWWWVASRRKAPATADGLGDARAILGVPRHADAATINAAWRRVIADVHPQPRRLGRPRGAGHGGTGFAVAPVTGGRVDGERPKFRDRRPVLDTGLG